MLKSVNNNINNYVDTLGNHMYIKVRLSKQNKAEIVFKRMNNKKTYQN